MPLIAAHHAQLLAHHALLTAHVALITAPHVLLAHNVRLSHTLCATSILGADSTPNVP